MAFVAIAIGAVAIGAGVAKAVVDAKGKKKALGAQAEALQGLKPLDIDELKTLAADTDIERYNRQFEEQRKGDPQFAAMRDRGAGNILQALNADASGNSVADKSLKSLASETESAKGSQEAFIKDLLDRAKADLEAGATLPPEFQAELVKAGLEGAGKAGLSIEGRGQAGSDIRRLLGMEGLALKENREANARTNLSAAENLRIERANLLKGLADLDINISGSKTARAAGAVTLGSAAVPAIGLTGADAARISAQNTDLANQVKLGLGNIKANQYLNSAARTSAIIGSVASGVTTAAGGMGGGGGAGAGSWISGLMGGSGAGAANGAGYIPQNFNTTPVGGYNTIGGMQQRAWG